MEALGNGGIDAPASDENAKDVRLETAFYNRASENSISHAEAKMIYPRHVVEFADRSAQQPTTAANAPLRPYYRRGSKEYHCEFQNLTSPKDPAAMPALEDLQFSEEESVESRQRAFSQDLSSEQLKTNSSSRHPLRSLATSQANLYTDISPELTEISRNIKKVLELRRHFMRLSLQCPGVNPKDWPSWRIYPPPPNPTWTEDKVRSGTPDDVQEPRSPIQKPRKAGHNIGDDFSLDAFEPWPEPDTTVFFELDVNSIYQIYDSCRDQETSALVQVPTLRDFYMAMEIVQDVSSDGPTKSFAYRQLDILEGKFQLYYLEHSYQEMANCKKVPHRDFYNVRKVDTHVHHSACMNQKHLLRFIKSKMKKCPDEVVLFRNDQHLTLQQVFDSIHLTAYDLSIDTLDMHAHTDSFHRFDKFNLKYNPVGESRLREIFLKTDNYINGRYLAELTREVISDLEASKYQFVEWRVSIYGRTLDEWDKLAAWVIDNKLVSHNVRWLVQIPRLYNVYKSSGQVSSFQDIIVNIFEPLYRVTREPTSNPRLHIFLQRVIGFDSVDDESKIETRLYKKFPPPREWSTRQNPPYTYWIYHLFANMSSLNAWRQRRGFNTFVLRPHCGEAGDIDHLAAAVLCCHSISHGLLLRKVPLLQYIFYLEQIGIAMSPLSNNALFLSYDRNPFPKYLKRGLNVSLSTDDPLQFAFTKEPLIEEYSVAAQIYRLSAVDMCELAYHSVIQSGFEHELKKRWLGENYSLPGDQGNNVAKTNVPDIREHFRHNTLMEELAMIDCYAEANKLGSPHLILRSPSVSSKPLSPESRNAESSIQSSAAAVFVDGNAEPSPVTTRPQPKIFPGIVHKRHRNDSIQQTARPIEN